MDSVLRCGREIVLVSDRIVNSIIEFVSDKVILLKFQTSYRKMDIIQIYIPMNEKIEAKIEEFYSILNKAMKIDKVIGNFNAKLGHGNESEYVSTLDVGNSRGDRLVQFCLENHLRATNIF